MSAADLLAGTVMDKSASLLNDTARTVYTYAVQVPYLQIALQELQEAFQLANIPMTEKTSAVIPMDAGQTLIVYNGGSTPTLPTDFVEPEQLWERQRNVDPWIPMTRRDFLPHNLEGVEITQFMYFTWQSQQIEVLPAVRNNDIKIDYIRELFTEITNEASIINVVNGRTFLEYRTAGLCAEFIERNMTSANSLNAYAALALDRVTGIGVKGKQTIFTRRRPFRSNYKLGGWAR